MSDLIAAYLFLGGAGSGAFLVAVVASWLNACKAVRGNNVANQVLVEAAASKAYVASFALLALGAICLLLDLERPDRAHLLFLMPTASYITVGTFSLAALMAAALFLALQFCVSDGRAARSIAVACRVGGAAVSVMVMAYTGFLLRSMGGVPLWDSLMLPVLFVLSSLSSGIAVMLICAVLSHDLVSARAGLESALAKVDLVLTIGQIVTCAVYLLAVSSDPFGLASVKDMLFGDWTAPFVGGYAILGLLVPATLDVAAARGKRVSWLGPATAVAVLAGCLCLRMCVVGAGVHIVVSGIGM